MKRVALFLITCALMSKVLGMDEKREKNRKNIAEIELNQTSVEPRSGELPSDTLLTQSVKLMSCVNLFNQTLPASSSSGDSNKKSESSIRYSTSGFPLHFYPGPPPDLPTEGIKRIVQPFGGYYD